MKRAVFACLTIAAVGCADTPTSLRTLPLGEVDLAAATSTTSEKFPFQIDVFVQCANGGAGEDISLSGTLHVVNSLTVSNTGNIVFKSQAQPQRLSGVGAETGDLYQGTGVTQTHITELSSLPYTETFVNNFRMIGQGPGNNFLVHQTVHITVNANGEVTAEVDEGKTECK
jgi:hypothetical protein